MSSTAIFLALLALALIGAALLALLLLERRRGGAAGDALLQKLLEAQRQDKSSEFLQRELQNLREQMNTSLAASARLITDAQKTMGDRLDNAAQAVTHVQRSLGALQAATEKVFDLGKEIAELQNILRAPKMRGSLGELLLGDLLAQILPPRHFTLQHGFRSGEIVDAVVRLGRLVPVDAKFPLENFRRSLAAEDATEKAAARRRFTADVKKHIDAIASKYIAPDEGTFDFALMYIPAENVYYETILREEGAHDEGSLAAYAFSRRVIPVSPNSFYAYLHTISLGLRGLQVEENARLLLEGMDRLRLDVARFREDFVMLGRHLGNARNKFDDADKRLGRVEDKLASLDREAPAAALPPAE
jgi:DNA recombination protein RmuC